MSEYYKYPILRLGQGLTVLGDSLIFSKNHRFQVFETFRLKNWPVPVISENRNKKACQFQLFKNRRSTTGFHERTLSRFFGCYIFTGLELKVGTMKILFSGSEPGAVVSQLNPLYT